MTGTAGQPMALPWPFAAPVRRAAAALLVTLLALGRASVAGAQSDRPALTLWTCSGNVESDYGLCGQPLELKRADEVER